MIEVYETGTWERCCHLKEQKDLEAPVRQDVRVLDVVRR